MPKEHHHNERRNSPKPQQMIDTRQKQRKPKDVIEPQISNAEQPEEEQKLPASKVDIIDDGLNSLIDPIVQKNRAPDKESEEEELKHQERSPNVREEEKVQNINQNFSRDSNQFMSLSQDVRLHMNYDNDLESEPLSQKQYLASVEEEIKDNLEEFPI